MAVLNKHLAPGSPDKNALMRIARTASVSWWLPAQNVTAIAASQSISIGVNYLINGTGVFQDSNSKNAVLPIPAQLSATASNLDNTFTALVTGRNHLGELRTVTWTATAGNVLKMETSGVIWSEIFDITFSATGGTAPAISLGYDYPLGNTFRAPLPFRLRTQTYTLNTPGSPSSDLLGVALMDKGGGTATAVTGAKLTILTNTVANTDNFCSFGATPAFTVSPTQPMLLSYIFKADTLLTY